VVETELVPLNVKGVEVSIKMLKELYRTVGQTAVEADSRKQRELPSGCSNIRQAPKVSRIRVTVVPESFEFSVFRSKELGC
jgi:hypothetical protein